MRTKSHFVTKVQFDKLTVKLEKLKQELYHFRVDVKESLKVKKVVKKKAKKSEKIETTE